MMSWLRSMARRDEGDRALGRHALLLASLILLLVALPITQILIGDTPRFPILLALVLIAAILVNSYERWVFIAALAVGLAASESYSSDRTVTLAVGE